MFYKKIENLPINVLLLYCCITSYHKLRALKITPIYSLLVLNVGNLSGLGWVLCLGSNETKITIVTVLCSSCPGPRVGRGGPWASGSFKQNSVPFDGSTEFLISLLSAGLGWFSASSSSFISDFPHGHQPEKAICFKTHVIRLSPPGWSLCFRSTWIMYLFYVYDIIQ